MEAMNQDKNSPFEQDLRHIPGSDGVTPQFLEGLDDKAAEEDIVKPAPEGTESRQTHLVIDDEWAKQHGAKTEAEVETNATAKTDAAPVLGGMAFDILDVDVQNPTEQQNHPEPPRE